VKKEFSLIEAYYPKPKLLAEGLNAKDLFLDVLQIALDTGAIAITGGAAGDTVVDVLVAVEVGADVIAEVESVISQAQELGSILSAAVSLDLTDNIDGFYDEVKSLTKKVTSNITVGEHAKEFIESASDTLEKIISRLVRAIGKWVSALFPDDFGLAGPAFEAAIGTAVSSALDNSYNIAASALDSLGETAKLITSELALKNWAIEKINGILPSMQEIIMVLDENDEEKKGWFVSMGANMQKAGENILDKHVPTFLQWGREMGLDIDTNWEDYLDVLRSLPDNHPKRLLFQSTIPKIIEWLTEIRDKAIPTAAKIMHKLISWLFASLALLQIISDDDEREEVIEIPTAETSSDPNALAAHRNLNSELLLREYMNILINNKIRIIN